MREKSMILLRKVSSLFKVDNGQWPSHVLDILETKYQLSPNEMLKLGCIRRRILKGKHPVDSLLIYDRVKADEKNISLKNDEDPYSNLDSFIFKGKIFEDGSVHLKKVKN